VADSQTRGKLSVAELVDGRPHALTLPDNLVPLAAFSERAQAIRFASDSNVGAYFIVTQKGFDRTLPTQPLTHKVEVFREYTDGHGKALTEVKLGDEIQVHLRLRSLGAEPIYQMAVVDLLPGGFEPVIQVQARTEEEEGRGGAPEAGGEAPEAEPEPEPGAPPPAGYALPIALPGSTFEAQFGDVREDRVVLYGTAETTVRELVYAIKASNTGAFTVAPIMADALYDRSVVARGVAGKITVSPR
jgi:uncharacterized protein YfaS (alpha-2-macroglobulin family)